MRCASPAHRFGDATRACVAIAAMAIDGFD
jgi:hypothetical protein